jgi:hypothetical protein
MTLLSKSVWWLLLTAIALRPALAQQVAPAPRTAPAGFRIAGTVVSKADAHPLARARITVRDVKDSQKIQFMITSDAGRFEFSGLPAGKYSLEGAKRGFISASYDQHDQFSTAIVTGADLDTKALTLRLAPDAVISGKIMDEVGDPVRHAVVTLYYVDHSGGVDQIHQFRGAQTDDQGAYELTPLVPGTYFLSASAKPWYAVHPNSDQTTPEERASSGTTIDRSLDVAYPVTYYPDVSEAESATPIPVRGGDHVQVDIHLNPVPAIRLLFRVADNGSNGYTVPQLQQPAFDGSAFVRTDVGRMVSPGVVEITGVPAGRYNVRLQGSNSTTQMNGVDLTNDGEELDIARGEALSLIKVSVQIANEAALPERLMVGLRSGRGLPVAWQAVNPKGEAELQQVAAGRYEVLVEGFTRRYSIARISAEGAETSGHNLTVAAGSSPSVTLNLVEGSVEVQGIAKRAGEAIAGAMVVLVPKDPETNRDLFRRDQSDLDGTFVLHAVVPGPYTLVAIDNGWELDWSQPGVIAAYLKHGETIQVGNQNGRPVSVAQPVEVQSK